MSGTDFITKKTCGNCRYLNTNDLGEDICMKRYGNSLPEDICEDYKCVFDRDESINSNAE